jgi:hypothetical protein
MGLVEKQVLDRIKPSAFEGEGEELGLLCHALLS